MPKARSSVRAPAQGLTERFKKQGERAARQGRSIQSKIDRKDKQAKSVGKKLGAMQAGARKYPERHLPGTSAQAWARIRARARTDV